MEALVNGSLVKLRTIVNQKHFGISDYCKNHIHEVELIFIIHFSFNRNAFYLYMVTSAACSSTPCYVHA